MIRPKVCVRFGHGGFDKGATSKDGTYEKDINLSVGLELIKLSKPYKNKIDFIFPRTTDDSLSLEKGVKIANDNNADLFISVHHNAYNGRADGAEVIHSINNGKGFVFAKMMMQAFKDLGQNERRVFSRRSSVNHNQDYYYEIRCTKMPAIITEFAFLDSDDYDIIDEKAEHKAEAQAILNTILKYFNIESKSNKPKPVEKPSTVEVKIEHLALIKKIVDNENVITKMHHKTMKRILDKYKL